MIGLLEWTGVIDWFRSVELIGLRFDLGIYTFVIGFPTEIITIALLLGVVPE